MAQMQDDQLRAITDGEMRQAVGYWSGKLGNMRQQAMQYYLGEATGDLSPPEVEGRSSVVSPDVRNTIEAMLPTLMVTFAGSETPVEFVANKPGDEDKAAQATDYVSYIYNVKNAGETVSYAWMKDALLSKNGIVKVWWDTRKDETREEYAGLSDVELSQVMDDEEVEITEQKSYPDEEDAEKRKDAIQHLTEQLQQAQQAAQQPQQAPQPGMQPGQGNQAMQAVQQLTHQIEQINSQPPVMLYDITCKRAMNANGKICVENVPPEEFLISRKAKMIADSPFVGHRMTRTLSELKSQGYKNLENIQSDDSSASMNMERIQRLGYDDEMAALNVDQSNNLDDSQRIVWVTECYIRVDYDGDGIAELRKVVRAGNQILENEVVDIAPFVSITPVPMPHKFFGLSVADLAMVTQKTKTGLLRGVLDNTWLQINGRYFAVDGQVNLDDLLTSRPGGVVRVKQQGAVGRLDQAAGNSELGMSMLGYMSEFNEDSTGWSKQSAGMDSKSLNDPISATQAQIVSNKADMRTDLIKRNFAEGFRVLFRMILKLSAQYQQKEQIVQLRGDWVACNPRDWRNGFETAVTVGLGTGSKDQLVAHLSLINQQQQFGLQIGTATPQNVYEGQKEMVKAVGFKSADKFFTDPAKVPPKPQQNPEADKAQAQMQIEQMKSQAQSQTDQARMQMEHQLENNRMQMQAQVDTHRQQVEAQQKTLELQQTRELEQIKHQSQMQLEQFKAQMAQDTAIQIAKINAEAKIIAAQVAANSVATQQQDDAADAAMDDEGVND
jgi:hypothetical protein